MSSALPFEVEFAHTDMGGVIFFGRYIELAHRAYEYLVRQQLNLDWATWFDNPDWLVPVRALTVDYLRPLRGGAAGEIQPRVEKIGRSSFTHSYTFLSQGNEAAIVRMTSVFVDRTTFRKISIPPLVLKLLQENGRRRTVAELGPGEQES